MLNVFRGDAVCCPAFLNKQRYDDDHNEQIQRWNLKI